MEEAPRGALRESTGSGAQSALPLFFRIFGNHHDLQHAPSDNVMAMAFPYIVFGVNRNFLGINYTRPLEIALLQ
jgi:hypothetical protein